MLKTAERMLMAVAAAAVLSLAACSDGSSGGGSDSAQEESAPAAQATTQSGTSGGGVSGTKQDSVKSPDEKSSDTDTDTDTEEVSQTLAVDGIWIEKEIDESSGEYSRYEYAKRYWEISNGSCIQYVYEDNNYKKDLDGKCGLNGSTLTITSEGTLKNGKKFKLVDICEAGASEITEKKVEVYINGNLDNGMSNEETGKTGTYIKADKAPIEKYYKYFKDENEITETEYYQKTNPSSGTTETTPEETAQAKAVEGIWIERKLRDKNKDAEAIKAGYRTCNYASEYFDIKDGKFTSYEFDDDDPDINKHKYIQNHNGTYNVSENSITLTYTSRGSISATFEISNDNKTLALKALRKNGQDSWNSLSLEEKEATYLKVNEVPARKYRTFVNQTDGKEISEEDYYKIKSQASGGQEE